MTTWGAFTRCLKAADEITRAADCAFYEYPTNILSFKLLASPPSIEDLAAGLKTDINHKYHTYDNIVLVCHSLGGLVAIKYLIDEVKAAHALKVREAVFYSVPNNGSGLAEVARYISFKHNQLRQLCRDSDLLRGLAEDWRLLKIEESVRVTYVVGGMDRIVSRHSAIGYWGNENTETVIGRGHTTILSPKDADDVAVLILKKVVANVGRH